MFSIRSPLDLAKLCQSAVLDNSPLIGNLVHVPESLRGKFPTMPEIEISDNGVAKLLSNLNIAKAAGPDAIKPIGLKELSHTIASAIAAIFKKSLDEGTVPAHWKRAQICPLYKKGDKSDPTNYGPVSLTCILCKSIEHIIASSLSKHFDRHNILYDLQHSFRERRLCETQSNWWKTWPVISWQVLGLTLYC